ncbi:LPS-assembly protein LptD [Acidihalobacter prosperus]
MKRGILLTSLVLAGLLLPPSAIAAGNPPGEWALCPLSPRLPVPSYQDGLVHIFADHSFLSPKGISRLEGHVQLTRGNQTVWSNVLHFNNSTQIAVSPGPFTLESPDMMLLGEHGFYDFGHQTGKIILAHYHLYPTHARGQASRINRQGPSQTTLHQATYSTCPMGHRAWQLSASKVHLNQADEVGTAHNVVIRFKGIPILYTPYLTFPLSNRRKTGLLPPVIGQSSNTGFEYRQPIYWNIAPQADATFTPEIFGKRGFGLGAQFRYLTPRSHSQITTNYLPDDRVYGGARYLFSVRQRTHPVNDLSTFIDYNRVSDPNYFNDLGNTLRNLDTTSLGQSAGINYFGKDWTLSAITRHYQILDPSLAANDKPYALLPQIGFNAHAPIPTDRLQLNLHSQWSRFERPDSIVGNRLDLMPSISLPLSGPAWYLTPSVAYRYTAYRLSNQPPGISNHLTRSLPIASLNGGVYFERNIGTHTLQIVEPRFYYLYVPYRNQQALPVFDTTEFPLNFAQMFTDNRFIGPDRVSNANQITAAITTRFINADTGRDELGASLGQIFYFQPQRVTLPGYPLNTAKRSDYVSRIDMAITRNWWANASVNLTPQTHRVDTAAFNAQYRLSRHQLINVGYHFYRDQYNQATFSMAWPITRHWQIATSLSYSPQDRQMIQAFAGAQYDTCCWALRVLGQRYLTTLNGRYNEGIFFQLILKGLGNLGSRIGTYLQRTIPDYAPPA